MAVCADFRRIYRGGHLGLFQKVHAFQHLRALVHRGYLRRRSGQYDRPCAPWLRGGYDRDQVYGVPISHGEGKFICEEKLLKQLIENGQIATQYVDLNGNPTYDIAYNPNGSVLAIEGITSPDGRVLGKMGHTERYDKGLYKNFDADFDMGLFKSLVEYYK